ncbi:two component signal transduction sytem histidine kinase [Thermosynechococcus sp. NK55a]|uniref:sensor histidine kinase n=1 Tax=Thermosynechococcus sp. NK55a TaxID=1394889 RepID=UPI0003D8AC8D|nr:HAMP domain-containing sensor histidine kinase [Thermosynechococcus sp. NK55a]AHB88074.1 two component signal transduction sytem histidine kinase [Thermosynechococcus sp. NK55a]
MFRPIRWRLLLSNLLTLAVVLGSFAAAVRVAFWQSLRQQLTDRLTALGQGVMANVEIEDRHFKVTDDIDLAQLQRQQQALQWFDLRGRLIAQQGINVLALPLDPKATVQTQVGEPGMQAVTLPILNPDTGQQVGYVRISQSLTAFEDTMRRLDWGLGVGVMVSLAVSGWGILWLTRQAMGPIEASFEQLKQFTADASHELRSPLMAIASNVEVSLKYAEGMRPEDREALMAIGSATQQMTRLVEDLLLLARGDRNAPLPTSSVNLSDLVREQVAFYQPQAASRGLVLTATIAPNLQVRGDREQLGRAFANLLQNAIQYTPAMGHVYVEVRSDRHTVYILVKDTGIGIAAEDLPQIFNRFWRADTARHYDEGGSGLGLSITQAIVQRHGGTITVSSQLQRGSCFTVKLPRQQKVLD